MKLHLGVLDVPYADKDSQTTGDVAEIIEAKYGVLGAFAEHYESQIADILAESVAGTIESAIAGVDLNPFAAAMSQIEDKMKQFIVTQEAEQVGLPGVPTQAALQGVNHRFKFNQGPRRPSFLDTTLMVASYRAWVDEPLEATPQQINDIAAIQRDIARDAGGVT